MATTISFEPTSMPHNKRFFMGLLGGRLTPGSPDPVPLPTDLVDAGSLGLRYSAAWAKRAGDPSNGQARGPQAATISPDERRLSHSIPWVGEIYKAAGQRLYVAPDQPRK